MNEKQIQELERAAGQQRMILRGCEADVAEFKRLEKANELPDLMKGSVDAANITQGTPITGNSYNVLIPQDISHMLYSAMLTRQERCALVQNLERENVNQVKRERVIKKRHGDPFLPIAMGEKSLPGVNTPVLDRIVATVRYYGVMPTLTHVAQNVNILQGRYPTVLADGKGGLKFERESGLEALAENLELVYWEGDNDFDSDEGDGFFVQMDAGGTANINIFDLRNEYLTFDKLIDYLAGVIRYGYEGKPSKLYLDAAMWAPLAKEAATKNRLDPAKGVQVWWNRDTSQLFMMGPTGQQLELVHSMFISNDWNIADWATASGEYTTMSESGHLYGDAVTSPTAGSVSQTGYFGSTEAGAYIYKIIPIFKKGRAAPFTCTAVTIADGDVAKFDFEDASLQTGTNPLVGYRVWRSDKDSTTVFHYLGKFGKNTSGTSSGTLFYDTNKRIPGTYNSAAIHHGNGAITDDILLESFQDDMGRIERELRMVLGTYRGLSVNMPRRHVAVLNARGLSF